MRKPNGYHSLPETVNVIVKSGGIAVLAHIMASKRTGVDDLGRLIAEFVDAGGIALELNTKKKVEHQTVRRLAK